MRVMPIIGSKLLDQIPFAMLIPHEDRAVLTHGQSLERLAGRGGLSPQEALAILDNVRQTPASLASCEFELINKVRDWRAGTKAPTDQGSAGPPQLPTFRPDEIATNGWKIRMVLFDGEGEPIVSRQPEVPELWAALDAAVRGAS